MSKIEIEHELLKKGINHAYNKVVYLTAIINHVK